MKIFKIISLIGYSGSGKTYFIENAIEKLKRKFHFEIGVIKNVHEHPVDSEGKDSYRYVKAGANLSIIRNKFHDVAFFFTKEMDIQGFINWIIQGPFELDLLLIEGFRDLSYPSILCVQNTKNIQTQLSQNVKMISGRITSLSKTLDNYLKIPVIDINTDFEVFVKIFNL
ncbi:MAG: molybdopterin-guanine dinucleotide biosynthesis protein B [Candidatus Lokiarchaeota archaeon]|nr:molybdopterin-guanine dinucleotide biosynthesis protein B [Candidatus Lokiarchaeota archaeon]